VHLFTSHLDTGIDNVYCHRIRVSRWLSPWRLFSFQRKVAERLRSEHFDIVYSLCQVYPVDVYRAGDGVHRHWMKVQYPNAAYRWMKYLTSLVHLAMRTLEGRICSNGNCRHFITNSKLVRTQLMDYFGLPEEKISVIYNGVDHGLFNPDVRKHRGLLRKECGIGEGGNVILFASNNWERKGLATILEAISMSAKTDVSLIVAGRGDRKRYLSFARKLGIDPGRLFFIGRVKDIERYYGASDIFILPSIYEPFANVCLEAMACGLPVITAKGNGASEIIVNGENGFVLEDWRDSERLSELIQSLFDPAVREEIGGFAAETARKYTWDRHVEETNEVLERVREDISRKKDK
jgi:UDP-glucose:(heptosyl)LPS alpha-1,3-glucosyltransferase